MTFAIRLACLKPGPNTNKLFGVFSETGAAPAEFCKSLGAGELTYYRNEDSAFQRHLRAIQERSR